jgi:hypothetical protein
MQTDRCERYLCYDVILVKTTSIAIHKKVSFSFILHTFFGVFIATLSYVIPAAYFKLYLIYHY